MLDAERLREKRFRHYHFRPKQPLVVRYPVFLLMQPIFLLSAIGLVANKVIELVYVKLDIDLP